MFHMKKYKNYMANILIHLSFLYILQMENEQHVERFANKHVDTVYQTKNSLCNSNKLENQYLIWQLLFISTAWTLLVKRSLNVFK